MVESLQCVCNYEFGGGGYILLNDKKVPTINVENGCRSQNNLAALLQAARHDLDACGKTYLKRS